MSMLKTAIPATDLESPQTREVATSQASTGKHYPVHEPGRSPWRLNYRARKSALAGAQLNGLDDQQQDRYHQVGAQRQNVQLRPSRPLHRLEQGQRRHAPVEALGPGHDLARVGGPRRAAGARDPEPPAGGGAPGYHRDQQPERGLARVD